MPGSANYSTVMKSTLQNPMYNYINSQCMMSTATMYIVYTN